MSQALTRARPYARAAFATARDAGHAPAWSQALALSARLAADPQVQALLGHPHLTTADALALLSVDGADEGYACFLEVLAENRRLDLLPEIAGMFEELRAESERIVKARVTSAGELQPAELAGIRAALQRRFGREIEVETAIDPELIGGAVIDTGELVIDGSLRGKLARLHSALAH